jgi:hypothetical protein
MTEKDRSDCNTTFCCSHNDVQFSFLIFRTMRHGSLCQIEIDMSLKLSNYEDTVRQLDIYYGLGKLCYLAIQFHCCIP